VFGCHSSVKKFVHPPNKVASAIFVNTKRKGAQSSKINATKINAAKQRAERYEKKKQKRKETHKEAAIAVRVRKRGSEETESE